MSCERDITKKLKVLTPPSPLEWFKMITGIGLRTLKIKSPLSLLPPTPICFNFFMSLLFLLFLTNRIFTTVSMACYLLGFYVVALGRRGTALSSLSLVVHALLLLLLLLFIFFKQKQFFCLLFG